MWSKVKHAIKWYLLIHEQVALVCEAPSDTLKLVYFELILGSLKLLEKINPLIKWTGFNINSHRERNTVSIPPRDNNHQVLFVVYIPQIMK